MEQKNIRFNIFGGVNRIDASTDEWGEIKVWNEGENIGDHIAIAKFFIDECEIYITDIEIIKSERIKGYDKMIIDILKGLSRLFSKPILTTAIKTKNLFSKNGFIPVLDDSLTNSVILKKGLWGDSDLIWIPEALVNKTIMVQ
jgi:hypothetical protein